MAIHSCMDIVPIFDGLNPEQKREISDAITHIKVKRNETLYLPGDTLDTLYILASGQIHLVKLNEHGKEQLVSILQPGEFMGELSIFNTSKTETMAVAKKDSLLCTLRYDAFQAFLLRTPQVAMKMLQALSVRVQAAQRQTLTIATDSVQNRIGRYLLETGGDIGMAKKDLASYLGTTPESVSRTLTALEEQGAIRPTHARKFAILKKELLLHEE